MFVEGTGCSSVEAVHKDHLGGGSIFKQNQKMLLFHKGDLQILESQKKVWAPRAVPAFLLLGFLVSHCSLLCLIWS